MKRLALAAVLVAGYVFAVPGYAANCQIRGTSHTDFIGGTRGADFICSRGADDYVAGDEGADHIRGGPNNDTLVGGNGHDLIRGLGGNDQLFAVDGAGGDVVRGGPGVDRCYGEKHDRFISCHAVVTNRSPTYPRSMVLALTRALEKTIGHANAQICGLDPLFCVIIEGGED